MINKLSLGLIFLLFVSSIIIFPYLPEKIPVHWNASGVVDGYAGRISIFFIPILSLALFLLLYYIPYLDPLKKNITSYYYNFIFSFLVFFSYLYSLTILFIFYNFNFIRFLALGFAFLTYSIGVLTKNSKMNWIAGIRTPYTLSSKVIWDKTHKLAGKLFKISSIFCLLGLIFPSIWIIIIPIILSAIIPAIYSYILYKK